MKFWRVFIEFCPSISRENGCKCFQENRHFPQCSKSSFFSLLQLWGRGGPSNYTRVTFRIIFVMLVAPSAIMDLLTGFFRGAVFHHDGVPENRPLTLMRPLPSWMGRFPTLMGRCPTCLFPFENPLENSPLIRKERTWAIACRRGSYKSLFLLNSGRFSPEKKGKFSSELWFA